MFKNISKLLEMSIGIFVLILAISVFVRMHSDLDASVSELENESSKLFDVNQNIATKPRNLDYEVGSMSSNDAQFIINSFYLNNLRKNETDINDDFESTVDYRIWVEEFGYLDNSKELCILNKDNYKIIYIQNGNKELE